MLQIYNQQQNGVNLHLYTCHNDLNHNQCRVNGTCRHNQLPLHSSNIQNTEYPDIRVNVTKHKVSFYPYHPLWDIANRLQMF